MHELLMIDDDRELCLMLGEYLAVQGMGFSFACDGREGLRAVRERKPDLVILDIMLPGMDGHEVLGAIRRDQAISSVPVIMLTARGEDGDRIRGLDEGADDYLPKPFNLRELLSRIQAVLRRCRPADSSGTGGIRLDSTGLRAWIGDEAIALTGQEFRALKILLDAAGSPVSRDDLSMAVCGRPSFPMARSLDMQMSRLRRKLGPNPDGSERIRSIRGEGYQYVSSATEVV